MHRSVFTRIAALMLVAVMATPAFAAPRRDDSPMAGIERAISKVFKSIGHIVQDLADGLTIPK